MPRIVFREPDGSERHVEADEGMSVMRAAVEHDVPGIVGECGGSMTCATCHVHVDDAWLNRVGPPSEEESFMLEFADDVRPQSRLSCQIAMRPDLDGVVLSVPATAN